MRDTVYIERSGGRFEVYAYAEGRRWILETTYDDTATIKRRYTARGFRVVVNL